jgi:hypothetical protein
VIQLNQPELLITTNIYAKPYKNPQLIIEISKSNNMHPTVTQQLEKELHQIFTHLHQLKYCLFEPQFYSRGYAVKRMFFQGGSIGTEKGGNLLPGINQRPKL